MKFDDLDEKMRVFETGHDLCVLPGLYMVARLDGRSFTRLTREVHQFEAPFDPRFRDLMVETAEHLMSGCGLNLVYGYTQSDEISLLFGLEENSFGRKLRKLISILAGEASAKFSLLLGAVASFDCRLSQLPGLELVVDYFRWRNEDAHRNALNAHCYWLLRKQGKGVGEATAALKGMSVALKNELLFQHGVNFNDLPLWQKRGIGLYWEEYDRPAENPVTGEKVLARRRRIRRDLELPMKDNYLRSCASGLPSHKNEKNKKRTQLFFRVLMCKHDLRPLCLSRTRSYAAPSLARCAASPSRILPQPSRVRSSHSGRTPSWMSVNSQPPGRGLRSILTRVTWAENFGTPKVKTSRRGRSISR